MRRVSVWFNNGRQLMNDDLYPMVMIEDGLSKRFHYKVKPSSLNRLSKIVNCWSYILVTKNGWSVENG